MKKKRALTDRFWGPRIRERWVRLEDGDRLLLQHQLVYEGGKLALSPGGANSDYVKLIEKWCEHTGCGRKISWDVFEFDKPCDITRFLLRWT